MAQEFSIQKLSELVGNDYPVEIIGVDDDTDVHIVPASAQDIAHVLVTNNDTLSHSVSVRVSDGTNLVDVSDSSSLIAPGESRFVTPKAGINLGTGARLNLSYTNPTPIANFFGGDDAETLVLYYYSDADFRIFSSHDNFTTSIKSFGTGSSDWPFTVSGFVDWWVHDGYFWILYFNGSSGIQVCAYDVVNNRWKTRVDYTSGSTVLSTSQKQTGVVIGDYFYAGGPNSKFLVVNMTAGDGSCSMTTPSCIENDVHFFIPCLSDATKFVTINSTYCRVWTTTDPLVPVMESSTALSIVGMNQTHPPQMIAGTGDYNYMVLPTSSSAYHFKFFSVSKASEALSAQTTIQANQQHTQIAYKNDTIYTLRNNIAIYKTVFSGATDFTVTDTGQYAPDSQYGVAQIGDQAYTYKNTTQYSIYDTTLERLVSINPYKISSYNSVYGFRMLGYTSGGNARVAVGYYGQVQIWKGETDTWTTKTSAGHSFDMKYHSASNTLYASGGGSTTLQRRDGDTGVIDGATTVANSRGMMNLLVVGDVLFGITSSYHVHKYTINVTTGDLTFDIESSATGAGPSPLCTDGTYIYSVGGGGTTLSKWLMTDLTRTTDDLPYTPLYVTAADYAIPDSVICDGTHLYYWTYTMLRRVTLSNMAGLTYTTYTDGTTNNKGLFIVGSRIYFHNGTSQLGSLLTATMTGIQNTAVPYNTFTGGWCMHPTDATVFCYNTQWNSRFYLAFLDAPPAFPTHETVVGQAQVTKYAIGGTHRPNQYTNAQKAQWIVERGVVASGYVNRALTV